MSDRVLAVVLAAGESTRMKSSQIESAAQVGNRPMIVHVMSALEKTGVTARGPGRRPRCRTGDEAA